MGSSKHTCGCGLASTIPLRGQLLVLLVFCILLFSVAAPLVMNAMRTSFTTSVEETTAYTTIDRSMKAMTRALDHEENVLYAYAVWNEMAYLADYLVSDEEDAMTNFNDGLVSMFFDYGHWSDWTCGNLMAFYSQPEENSTPRLLWSEYHVTDPETLEMDLYHASPLPSFFNSSEFISKLVDGEIRTGFLAIEDVMFIISCQPIFNMDDNTYHGSVCRATDIRTSLESISSGAGACISFYSMDSNDIPKEFRDHFDQLEHGHHVDGSKYDGGREISEISKDKWDDSLLTLRMCGPAEVNKANITPRTMAFIRMANVRDVMTNADEKNNGFGIILDSARELEPLLDKNFSVALIILFVFGLLVFIVYGFFTEFAVIRKLNLIAEAAYEALVEGEEDDYNYYTGSSHHKNKDKQRERGKNELITMATLAAQTVEKNGNELERKRDLLVIRKMLSSFYTDQLRLLSVYCGRDNVNEDGVVPVLKIEKKRRKSYSLLPGMNVIQASDITLDRILTDPFAIEVFKNFSIRDKKTNTIKYPARKGLLFMLSTLFYRSMGASCIEARLDCIKGIIEEFFGVQASVWMPKKKNNGEEEEKHNDLGISDAARTTLLANAKKCVASRHPNKTLFDDSSSAVQDHLTSVVFPQFMKTQSFSLLRVYFAWKKSLQEKQDAVERILKSEQSSSVEMTEERGKNEKKLREMKNDSDGTELSRGVLAYLSDF